MSSGTLAPDEPYLRNNPAFEAYMDSDDGSSTGSVESNACTTPRSAIHEQVVPRHMSTKCPSPNGHMQRCIVVRW